MSDLLHEDELAAELRRVASRVVVPSDGRHRVTARLARRRRRRRRARFGATLLVVLVAAVGVTWVDRGDDATDMATASGEDGADEGGSAAGRASDQPLDDDEALPGLTIVHPDYEPMRADATDDVLAPEDLPTAAHLQSFRAAQDEWDVPMVFIRTVRDENESVGELAPQEDVTVVDVNGAIGFLVEADGRAPMLGWRLPDGTATTIVAPGLASEDLLAFGRSLRPRQGGDGWIVDDPPAGLEPIIDAALPPLARWRSHTSEFGEPFPAGSGFRPVTLRTFNTTPEHFEAIVAGIAGDGRVVRTTSVRGEPAAVVSLGDEIYVTWSEHAGTVGNELRLSGPAVDDLDELLDSIVELDDRSWQELVERLEPA